MVEALKVTIVSWLLNKLEVVMCYGKLMEAVIVGGVGVLRAEEGVSIVKPS